MLTDRDSQSIRRWPGFRASCSGSASLAPAGSVYEAGDTEHKFSIMSVSKPFVFALVCETIGPEDARARLGANATGLPFNSLAAVEQGRRPYQSDGECGRDRDDEPRAGTDRGRSMAIHSGRAVAVCGAQNSRSMKRFMFRPRRRIFATAVSPGCCRATTASIATPKQATDLHSRQCSLNVSARDLAVMGATLADGGVNPVTKQRVVDAARLPLCAHGDDHRRLVRDLGRLAL